MNRYKGGFIQDGSLGVLLTNLGTPDAPTPAAVRRYLAQFLWDPRVVELPRLLWWMILHGVVLRVRPRRSAHAYRKIWGDRGSPLLAIGQRQAAALQEVLSRRWNGAVTVALGMRYGNPSIGTALEGLRGRGMGHLLVLPLYPQYASPTIGSTFDAVAAELRTWRWVPELRIVGGYHDHGPYLEAVTQSVRQTWAERERPDRLLFSFHGLPQRIARAGDPYSHQCHATAQRVAERLKLIEGEWAVSFQSRFGREEWLRPYTDQTLREWAAAGVGRVDVLCPGFAADCLETLEEVALQNRSLFLRAGGRAYHYIPALNDHPDHIHALADLVMAHIQGWS
jgi:ferrochelatase